MLNPESIKLVDASSLSDAALELAATWSGGTVVNLADLKGSPFSKVTFDPKSVQTQNGNKTMGKTAKVEIGVLTSPTAALAASLRALEGKKVAALCTPKGVVSATHPYELIKNWILQIKGELNSGETSFITLFNDSVPTYDETDVIKELTALGGGE